MHRFKKVLSVVIGFLTLASIAKADPFPLITTTYQLTSANTKQLGRPFRSGIPQDWSGTESYMGITAAGSTYYNTAFTFSSATFVGAPYIDISTYDAGNGSSYFLSAFSNAYNPSNRGANWLGDAGFSGNYQTNTGGDFQVILPSNSDLVLVLNSTLANGALPNYAFQFTIGAYSDASYSDPIANSAAVTPEPSSLLLLGTGMLGIIFMSRKRFV